MIDQKEVRQVNNAMRTHGGAFVESLGEALSRADLQNQAKIKRSWPKLWEQYKRMGAQG